MTLLSFVIPCYRSEDTIRKVVKEIDETVLGRDGYDYEAICVNDGSPDGVLGVLRALARENRRVKVIDLAKNMGKESAIMAGYSAVRGQYVVNLDDDFQCPVNCLWDLLAPVEEDRCDCATAEYSVKKESRFKIWGSNLNRWMSHIMLEKPLELRFENFNILKRFVVDEILHYKNPYPYLEGLVFRVTDRVLPVPMQERERGDEKGSGFTLAKSVSQIVNGLTAFSVIPLRVASVIGAVFALCGFIYGLITVIQHFTLPDVPMGYSTIASILMFSTGLIMCLLGLIGEYLGRIYICINDSPQYVIRETINLDAEGKEEEKRGE